MTIRKATIVAVGMLALALAIGGILIARHWPFSERTVTEALQEEFPATVTFDKFHATFFPRPGCVAEGVAFRRLGGSRDTAPIVTIQRLTIAANYIDMFVRPGYLARIVMNGFHVYVPAAGASAEPSGWHASKSTARVGEIIADGASIEVARSDEQAPLLFAIHTLKLSSISKSNGMGYEVAMRNALPAGEIRAHGHFGPWNYNDAGQTPVDGHYVFQGADLGAFQGIAGMLSSEDKFQGVLGNIESQGSIDIPDFMVTRSKHPIHLYGNFHAFVNGTNGDVQLERVNASFLKTRVVVSGKVAGAAGEHGKTTAIDLSVRDGRIEDVLRMFVRAAKPPFSGVVSFRAHVILPPGKPPFVEKVRLAGDFGIEGGQFEKPSTQKDIAALSEKSRGVKPDGPREDADPERVISNVAGHLELRNGTATFADASFHIPGALAQMHGTYNLETEAVNLHGTLKTEAELSEMTGGFKSVLLKPFNVFFKRKQAGAVIPVHLIGTYSDPQAGLDLPVKTSPDKTPAGATN